MHFFSNQTLDPVKLIDMKTEHVEHVTRCSRIGEINYGFNEIDFVSLCWHCRKTFADLQRL